MPIEEPVITEWHLGNYRLISKIENKNIKADLNNFNWD